MARSRGHPAQPSGRPIGLSVAGFSATVLLAFVLVYSVIYLVILPIVFLLLSVFAVIWWVWLLGPEAPLRVVAVRAGAVMALGVVTLVVVLIVRGPGETGYDLIVEGRTLAESFTIVEWDVVERDERYIVTGDVRNDGDRAASVTFWLTLHYPDGRSRGVSMQPAALGVNVPPDALWAFEHEVSAPPGARSFELRTSFGRVR